jgi:hypothetical protein
MIPGAKHAPIITVGYVTERGGFYTAIEDIPKIERVDTGELIPDAHIEACRQLTVTDPDDQRVIWRLAAIAIGATEEQARTTVLRRGRVAWLLESNYTSFDGRGQTLILREIVGRTVEEATAALCAVVWGPA